MGDVDIDAYFARLGYDGPAEPTLRTLERIHALHPQSIPFENLSPFVGEPVRLDIDSLQDKLLHRGRGGWCFEHNILLAQVLEDLGFQVTRLAARVRWTVPPERTTPRSHMLLLVKLAEGPYIADVGFGGITLTAPLRLEAGIEQKTPHETYRFVALEHGFRLEAHFAGEWRALHVFDLAQAQLADYEVSNFYLCHHPDSHFLKQVVAARTEPARRHAVRGVRYAIHYPDGRTERREITELDEYRRMLEGPLQIRLPDAPNLDQRLQAMIDARSGADPASGPVQP